MRSFICSALFIATVLIGQQWVAKSSEAKAAIGPAALQGVVQDAGYAKWMAGAR